MILEREDKNLALQCSQLFSSHYLTTFRLLSMAVRVFAQDNNALLSFVLLSQVIGMLKDATRKPKRRCSRNFEDSGLLV